MLGQTAAACPRLAALAPASDLAVESLVSDAADGQLDGHDLLTAALLASRVENDELRSRCHAQAERWRREFRDQKRLPGSPVNGLGSVRRIHEFMHAVICTGDYREQASSPIETIETGDYNCVSATFWYVWLARQDAEISDNSLQIVETPGHVCLRYTSEQGDFGIEPTCPRWQRAVKFRPPGEPSAKARWPVRVIPVAGLVAMLLFNRGLDALEHEQFPTALALNRQALAMDPQSGAARHNVTATVNAWALAELQAQRWLVAHGLLTAAVDDGFSEPALLANLEWTRQRWLMAAADSAVQWAAIVAAQPASTFLWHSSVTPISLVRPVASPAGR